MIEPDFTKQQLIPAIVQNASNGRVLMLAYMNEDSYRLTRETQLCHFWSRSRDELWLKGSTSGNTLSVVSIELDCDSDAILIKATPQGPSCHNGTESCFDTRIESFEGESND